MELTASFYIGVDSYTDDSFDASSPDAIAESARVDEIVRLVELGQVFVSVEGPGFTSTAAEVRLEYFETDDQLQGVPVLVYLYADFDLDDDIDYFNEYDDSCDDLAEDVKAVLRVGPYEINDSEIECEELG